MYCTVKAYGGVISSECVYAMCDSMTSECSDSYNDDKECTRVCVVVSAEFESPAHTDLGLIMSRSTEYSLYSELAIHAIDLASYV